MALSQNLEVKSLNKGYTVTRQATAADTFYKGAFVNVVAATGEIIVAADTATHVPDGYVAEYVVAADADDVKVVINDVAWFNAASSTAAQTDVRKFVYATADDTLSTTTATNVLPIGQIVDVDLVNDLWLIDFSKGNVVVIDNVSA